ncbi:hypothetical protein [Sphingomonas mollis]|uniref:Uncharacterized protein n=1 Tax=Sphingomonas mollis TaxID=2795726 RepID=A0ABS0XPA5_9SPHN|nr:hypothetical protein [Sphingomonas sp. BT553]MBJ6121864.1 hypothetical protein [Sphingomonas sp. BT553]
MTQLGDAVIGTLTDVIALSFGDAEDAFWAACRTQDAQIRNEVADAGFRIEVGAALTFLDRVQQAALVLGPLLLARPADAGLRKAIGAAHPPALAAVSEERFALEAMIGATLTSVQAVTLRTSLDQIDALMAAVTAYKGMHDALHVLQPLLPLMRSAAMAKPRWPELRVYTMLFRQQLNRIDAAIADLNRAGVVRLLDFRAAMGGAIDAIDAALAAGDDYALNDAASELAASVDEGLNSVDVSMLNTAQDANQPFTLALQFFTPLVQSTAGTRFEALITSYVAFADQVSRELIAAIAEHGKWQRLDRQFDLLQRIVVENQPGAPGDIDRIWRLTLRELTQVCGAQPVSDWASPIVQLIALATVDLKPPVAPPVIDAARDRISELISNGRSRFMAVDQSLLAWLGRSVQKRPDLIALLKGEVGHG